MPDDLKGRRGRVRPERARPMHPDMAGDLDALRAAGVSQEAIAAALSRRYRSAAAQRAALRALMGKQSGVHTRDLKVKRK